MKPKEILELEKELGFELTETKNEEDIFDLAKSRTYTLDVNFERQKAGGYLILPVLVMKYDFLQFERLSKINFFKTYYSEYGFTKPIERNKLIPFDKLAENENTTNEQLNLYYEKLADFIHTAVSNKFKS